LGLLCVGRYNHARERKQGKAKLLDIYCVCLHSNFSFDFFDFLSGGIKLAELLCALERRNEATGAHSEAVRR
jgi:hypothetical protein